MGVDSTRVSPQQSEEEVNLAEPKPCSLGPPAASLENANGPGDALGGVVHFLAFSHDSTTIAALTSGPTIRLWSPSTGWQQVLEGHKAGVLSVAFSHDSKLLVSVSIDSVKIWDLAASGRCLYTKRGNFNAANFSHDSKLLAIASPQKFIMILRVDRDADEVLSFQRRVGWNEDWFALNTTLAFSSDSKYLAASTIAIPEIPMTPVIHIPTWNVETGHRVQSSLRRYHEYGELHHVTFADTASDARCHLGNLVLSQYSAETDRNNRTYQLTDRGGFAISDDAEWIQRDAMNLFRIPSENRPGIWIVRGSTMCIADRSGRISVYNFDDDNPDA